MASPDSAPSIELVLTTWLSTLGKASTRRKAKDPLPHRLVSRVAGSDTPEVAQDVAVVSVHTFAESPEAAVIESEKTHRRMLELALDPLTEIALPGGVKVGIDYCSTVMKPVEVDYQDPNVVRYVGRYEVGLPYISTP